MPLAAASKTICASRVPRPGIGVVVAIELRAAAVKEFQVAIHKRAVVGAALQGAALRPVVRRAALVCRHSKHNDGHEVHNLSKVAAPYHF